jgi:hypothetical protein
MLLHGGTRRCSSHRSYNSCPQQFALDGWRKSAELSSCPPLFICSQRGRAGRRIECASDASHATAL